MSNPLVLNSDTLDCGCVIGQAIIDEHKTFFMNPCSTNCKYYKYAMERAKERNMPIEYKEHL